MSDPETETVNVTIIGETEKAYRLSDGELEGWFPKSEVTFQRRNIKTGKATAEIPLWLLEAKGWNQ